MNQAHDDLPTFDGGVAAVEKREPTTYDEDIDALVGIKQDKPTKAEIENSILQPDTMVFDTKKPTPVLTKKTKNEISFFPVAVGAAVIFALSVVSAAVCVGWTNFKKSSSPTSAPISSGHPTTMQSPMAPGAAPIITPVTSVVAVQPASAASAPAVAVPPQSNIAPASAVPVAVANTPTSVLPLQSAPIVVPAAVPEVAASLASGQVKHNTARVKRTYVQSNTDKGSTASEAEREYFRSLNRSLQNDLDKR